MKTLHACARISIVASLFVAPLAHADPVRFHGFGGITTSRMSVNGDFRVGQGSGGPGVWLGIGARLPTGARTSLVFEPSYVTKVANLTFSLPPGAPGGFQFSGFFEGTLVGYLELPLALRFDITSGAVRPYVLAGASIAFKLHTSDAQPDLVRTLEIDSIDGLVNSTATNVIVGAGLEFANDRWYLEGRASLGVTDAFTSSVPGTEVVLGGTKLRAFVFGVGYRF